MGQGASNANSDAEQPADEEVGNQSPQLLNENNDDEERGNHPAQLEAVPDVVAAPPPPLDAGAQPARAPDVYFGAAFLPDGFVPAPQDALLLGLRPELAALVSNGILGRLPQIPAVQFAPSAQSLVHIHRDSIQLQALPEQPNKYCLSLRVDALEDCVMQAYWRASESSNGAQVTFASSAAGATDWPITHLSEGKDQLVTFERPLDLENVPEDVLQWELPEGGAPPLSFVISTSTPGSPSVVDTEIVTARVLQNAGGGFAVRVVRVRSRFRGRFYVLYELYGAADNAASISSSGQTLPAVTGGGRECVICITDPRDTVVLPCRHMCLCVPCAEALRTQTNKCPLCRTPVKGLLRVGLLPTPSPSPSHSRSSSKIVRGEELEEVQLLTREPRSTTNV